MENMENKKVKKTEDKVKYRKEYYQKHKEKFYISKKNELYKEYYQKHNERMKKQIANSIQLEEKKTKAKKNLVKLEEDLLKLQEKVNKINEKIKMKTNELTDTKEFLKLIDEQEQKNIIKLEEKVKELKIKKAKEEEIE